MLYEVITQVYGIEHELDAEKHRDNVLFDDETDGSCQEQKHAEDKIVR